MNKVYRVIKIISEYKIVVNAGSTDLIHEGQLFEIFAPGKEVIDPETGENLGSLDYVKAKLYAQDVFPRMCVCVNQESESVSLFVTNLQSERVLPLRVDSKEISGGFEGIEKKIRIGDLVRPTD